MRIWERALHWFANRRYRFKLRGCDAVGAAPLIEGPVRIHGGGSIRIGDRVHLRGDFPVELFAWRGGEIVIGDDVVLEEGVRIEAHGSVRIGSRSRLGAYCRVFDHPFSLPGLARPDDPAASVVVGEEVQVGPRAILLPGSVVERGATVCAGVVISQRVPAGAFERGLPVEQMS